jgi:hypothetical protein
MALLQFLIDTCSVAINFYTIMKSDTKNNLILADELVSDVESAASFSFHLRTVGYLRMADCKSWWMSPPNAENGGRLERPNSTDPLVLRGYLIELIRMYNFMLHK